MLKDGGKLWYYTAGKNDIANSLLDLARDPQWIFLMILNLKFLAL